MALTPDLGFAAPEQPYGFDSHVIIRRPPAVVWDVVTAPDGWARFSAELRPLRGARVLVSEAPEEHVFEARYLGVAVRHGFRCEPYWHADEDEDAPAVSCRLVHSLVSFGVPAQALAGLGALKELEDRFHRFNEALRRHLEADASAVVG